MLRRINQKLGASLSPLEALLSWLGAWLVPLIRALVGVWQAPAWMRWFGRGLQAALSWCRWHGVQVLAVVILGVALWSQSAWLKRWWHGLLPDRSPKVELTLSVMEPERTRVEEQLPPNPLIVEFSGQAAPLVKVGKGATDITMDPPAAGTWTWAAANKLVFQPKEDWPVGQKYEVSLGRKALASNVQLAEQRFQFSSPAFKVSVDSAEFYQDPVQVNLRRVVYQLRFSHPVDAKKFESSVRLDEGDPGQTFLGIGQGPGRKVVISYDPLKLQATLMSEPLPIPAETQSMRLTVAAMDGFAPRMGRPISRSRRAMARSLV